MSVISYKDPRCKNLPAKFLTNNSNNNSKRHYGNIKLSTQSVTGSYCQLDNVVEPSNIYASISDSEKRKKFINDKDIILEDKIVARFNNFGEKILEQTNEENDLSIENVKSTNVTPRNDFESDENMTESLKLTENLNKTDDKSSPKKPKFFDPLKAIIEKNQKLDRDILNWNFEYPTELTLGSNCVTNLKNFNERNSTDSMNSTHDSDSIALQNYKSKFSIKKRKYTPLSEPINHNTNEFGDTLKIFNSYTEPSVTLAECLQYNQHLSPKRVTFDSKSDSDDCIKIPIGKSLKGTSLRRVKRILQNSHSWNKLSDSENVTNFSPMHSIDENVFDFKSSDKWLICVIILFLCVFAYFYVDDIFPELLKILKNFFDNNKQNVEIQRTKWQVFCQIIRHYVDFLKKLF